MKELKTIVFVFLGSAIVFAFVNTLGIIVDITLFVDWLFQKSKPTIDKTPHLLIAAIAVVSLVIAKGKPSKHQKENILFEMARRWGPPYALSSSYVLSGMSGLLFGVGFSEKVVSGTVQAAYVIYGLLGLLLASGIVWFAHKLLHEFYQDVGNASGKKKMILRTVFVSLAFVAIYYLIHS